MFEDKDFKQLMTGMAQDALKASRELAVLSTNAKNAILVTLSEKLLSSQETILEKNAEDLKAAETMGLSQAMIDRLRFTEERIEKMAEGIRQVIALPDPVGETMQSHKLENGIDLKKVRVPMGVIGIIYESRPNVTIDCAILCLKSGNASILRGGKEAFHTNTILAEIISESLVANGVSEKAVQLVPTIDRQALGEMLKLNDYIHCIIPRGGEGLIRYVVDNSTIPVIKHFTGVCSVYVDTAADIGMAEGIVVNAKTQRPGVCNAAENLIIHSGLVGTQLPQIAKALAEKGVELRADEQALAALTAAGVDAKPAIDEDWGEEYLDLIISIKTVEDVQEAIDFINTYGSCHSDAIVTKDEGAAKQFLKGVDASSVYWNASTRFTDGFEFGLGAEIGISTDRLHARGPMGLRELCTYKYMAYGTGQIKG